MTRQQVIDNYVARLRAAGAHAVDSYEKTIRNHVGNENQVLNFLSEAVAALMFLEHGAEVTMRDKPDLYVTLRGESFYAEVKHFNRKEQDDFDEEAQRNAPEYEFVRVGDTVPTEEAAQELDQWDTKSEAAGLDHTELHGRGRFYRLAAAPCD
jgi:hypothetical protein